jgi:hypothetical protein
MEPKEAKIAKTFQWLFFAKLFFFVFRETVKEKRFFSWCNLFLIFSRVHSHTNIYFISFSFNCFYKQLNFQFIFGKILSPIFRLGEFVFFIRPCIKQVKWLCSTNIINDSTKWSFAHFPFNKFFSLKSFLLEI